MVYLVFKNGEKSSKRSINKKNTGFTILGVDGLKKEISLISAKIDRYIKRNNLTGTYRLYCKSLFIKEVIRCC